MNDSLKLELKSQWDEIDRISDTLNSFLKKQNFPEETNHALFMISVELLENAIKYGSFRGKSNKIELSLEISPKDVLVEVLNPVEDGKSFHLKRLDETIQWIRGFQSPFQAYIEKMKEVSVKSFEDEESGLGLVRIAYEGRAILDFFVNEENILAVSAIYRIMGATNGKV